MKNKIDFSVIIPHRNSIETLSKLLETIPHSERIEIIIIDNSPIPIVKESISSAREYTLLYSPPEKGAGGARNVGIENAHGEWLIFADADDFFTDSAFDTFYENKRDDAELVYFCAASEYIDTGEKASRGDSYTNLVRDYLSGSRPEMDLRLCFSVPWAKMVKHTLVEKYKLRYDEVVASNDMFFSLLTGYYANTVLAIDKEVYVVTVSRGSLTRRRDRSVTESRFQVYLRYNEFVKKHNLGGYQKSVMVFIARSFDFGLSYFFKCIKLLIYYHQNPFIGWERWLGTILSLRKSNKKEKKYIVR